MCLTLNSSLKSNYFSLTEDNVSKLNKIINESMVWLVSHQEEQPEIYLDRIKNINELCNGIYHSMHKMKALESINISCDLESDSDSDSDDSINVVDNKIPDRNKIKEDIDSLIDKLPTTVSRNRNGVKPPDSKICELIPEEDDTSLPKKQIIEPKKEEQLDTDSNSEAVLLKIDINKLAKVSNLKYNRGYNRRR